MSHTALEIIAIFLLIPGLIGVFVPIVPGVPYMFFVALIFGMIDRFQYLTYREIGFLAVVAFVSLIIDHLSGLVGGTLGGATKKALYFGLIGSVVGFVVFPPFGTIIGLFLGVLIGGVASGQSESKATHAAAASVIGSVAGMGINLVLAITFIGLFITFAQH